VFEIIFFIAAQKNKCRGKKKRDKAPSLVMITIPQSPIVIDSFRFIPGVYIYLLSHLHSGKFFNKGILCSNFNYDLLNRHCARHNCNKKLILDHTSGLTPSWNFGTIYCSHVTRAILLEKFRINPELVIGLDEDRTHIISLDNNAAATTIGNNTSALVSSSATPPSQPKGVTMQLTLIDANHCPGACMFLIESYFGTILHTGDFRFDPLILQHFALQNKKIDVLHLDDTYANPDYVFPTRVSCHQSHYILYIE